MSTGPLPERHVGRSEAKPNLSAPLRRECFELAQFRTGKGAVAVTQAFAHLHVHTEYSLVDSTVRIAASGVFRLCARLSSVLR